MRNPSLKLTCPSTPQRIVAPVVLEAERSCKMRIIALAYNALKKVLRNRNMYNYLRSCRQQRELPSLPSQISNYCPAMERGECTRACEVLYSYCTVQT
jgi:hypothetical protein